MRISRALLFSLMCSSCASIPAQDAHVRVGADVLLDKHLQLLKGKRIGLVVNHTSRLSDGRHVVDAIAASNECRLAALFAPEHSIRGTADAPIADEIDSVTRVAIYSLYGPRQKPTLQQLSSVDYLIFDIQDVGSRFYTYISTLGYVMESAAEAHVPVIVLDRPNPVTGVHVDGPVMEDPLRSNVGYAEIPILHGMTVGELAMMYNGEGWLGDGRKVDLTVIMMQNWSRDLWYDRTGLVWIKPSPSMISLSTAIVYPGTCLFEGTNISEGRGSDRPFEYIGAPWMNSAQVIDLLEKEHLPGVQFESVQFTPSHRSGSIPKFLEQGCNGIYVHVVERDRYEPVRTGIHLLSAAKAVHPEKFQWKVSRIDSLCGTSAIRTMIDAGRSPDQVVAHWKKGVEDFMKLRKKYLLYN